MKTATLFTSLGLLISLSLFSQNTGRLHGYSFAVGGGYAQFNSASMTNINIAMGLNQFAPVDGNLVMWDMDLFNVMQGRFVADFDMGFFPKQNKVFEDSRTTTSGTNMHLRIGCVAYAGKHFLFYPTVGYAPGSISLHSHQQAIPLLNDVEGTNNFHALDFALNFDWYVHAIQERTSIFTPENSTTLPKDIFSQKISFTAGYCFSPWKTFWNDNNIDITDTHNSNVNFETDVIGVDNSSSIGFFYLELRYGFGMMRRSAVAK